MARDDWLFVRGEFEPNCFHTGAKVGAALETAAATLQVKGISSGSCWCRTSTPYTRTRYQPDLPFPAFVRGHGPGRSQRGHRRLDGVAIDARDALLAARLAPGAPLLYYTEDTHWTPDGAAIAVRELVGLVRRRTCGTTPISSSGRKARGDGHRVPDRPPARGEDAAGHPAPGRHAAPEDLDVPSRSWKTPGRSSALRPARDHAAARRGSDPRRL